MTDDQNIKLSDGSSIILDLQQKTFKSKEDQARNIFLIDRNNKVIWQVRSDSDLLGHTFYQLSQKNGKIIAYRADGVDYEIDIQNGFAKPVAFRK